MAVARAPARSVEGGPDRTVDQTTRPSGGARRAGLASMGRLERGRHELTAGERGDIATCRVRGDRSIARRGVGALLAGKLRENGASTGAGQCGRGQNAPQGEADALGEPRTGTTSTNRAVPIKTAELRPACVNFCHPSPPDLV